MLLYRKYAHSYPGTSAWRDAAVISIMLSDAIILLVAQNYYLVAKGAKRWTFL